MRFVAGDIQNLPFVPLAPDDEGVDARPMTWGEGVCEDETVGDMNRGVVLPLVGLPGDTSFRALYFFATLNLAVPPLFAVVVISVRVPISCGGNLSSTYRRHEEAECYLWGFTNTTSPLYPERSDGSH